MPDCNENPIHRQGRSHASLCVAQHQPIDDRGFIRSRDLFYHRIPDHPHLRIGRQPLLQNPLGPEAVAPMDHRHRGRMMRQIQCLLDRRIAPADHRDMFFSKEKSIACRAGRNAETLEFLFRIEPEPPRLRPGRDNHRVGQINIPRVAHAAERPHRKIDRHDQVIHHCRADMRRLRRHLLHQPRSLHRLGEPGIVLHLGGDGQLPPRLQSGHQHRLERSTRRIDRRRVAGGAGSDDQDTGMMSDVHRGFRSRFPTSYRPD